MIVMRVRNLCIIIMIFGVLISSTLSVVAQAPSASVTIDCEEIMQISVSPGSSTTESVTCVVENPTIYEEKIRITVTGNLTYSAPGSLIIQGGSSESFDLVIVAEERMSAGSHSVNVEVSVQEISGVPPANAAKDDSNIVVEILRYGDCSVSAKTSLIEVGLGEDANLQFIVANLGNGADSIELSLSSTSRTSLEFLGYIVTISSPTIDLGEQQSLEVSLTITAPVESSPSAKREGSRLVDLHTLDLVVTSQYSCDSSTGCVSDSTSVTLKLIGESSDSDASYEPTNMEESSFESSDYMIFGSGVVSGVMVLYVLYALFKKS